MEQSPENPDGADKSPLDVEGIDIDITAEEILEFIREGRSG